MNLYQPAQVLRLLLELEPRLEAGYEVEAEAVDEFWELRFALGGRHHRLRLDPLYVEECLNEGRCRHLREVLSEVCSFLEAT